MDRDGKLAGSSAMKLFTPSLHVKTIYEIPFSWLKERSVTSVITDLDNTLVPWRDYRVAKDLSDWFDSLHSEGFRTVILTNARPSPTIQKMSEDLKTELVVGARKPISRFFRLALEKVSARPHEACVVGDQIFTDVLGGNLIGCYTILVDRIGDREFLGTRIMRLFERLILRYVLAEPTAAVSCDGSRSVVCGREKSR
ncbi:MAG TPA: YqeG family HAD IIIA-type phosphatase [Firmicutes bacterium]|nr:YqeG family HAD IIIA-type phosphatase [Candidatus Fermentithermobacillaceae bacterium]